MVDRVEAATANPVLDMTKRDLTKFSPLRKRVGEAPIAETGPGPRDGLVEPTRRIDGPSPPCESRGKLTDRAWWHSNETVTRNPHCESLWSCWTRPRLAGRSDFVRGRGIGRPECECRLVDFRLSRGAFRIVEAAGDGRSRLSWPPAFRADKCNVVATALQWS